MSEDAPGLRIELIGDAPDAMDAAWQEECRQLARGLERELRREGLKVSAERAESAPVDGATRSGLPLSDFSSLLLTVIETGVARAVASRVFDLMKSWLGRRSECRAVIKTSDGSEFTFENLTREQMIELMERHR